MFDAKIYHKAVQSDVGTNYFIFDPLLTTTHCHPKCSLIPAKRRGALGEPHRQQVQLKELKASVDLTPFLLSPQPHELRPNHTRAATRRKPPYRPQRWWAKSRAGRCSGRRVCRASKEIDLNTRKLTIDDRAGEDRQQHGPVDMATGGHDQPEELLHVRLVSLIRLTLFVFAVLPTATHTQ